MDVFWHPMETHMEINYTCFGPHTILIKKWWAQGMMQPTSKLKQVHRVSMATQWVATAKHLVSHWENSRNTQCLLRTLITWRKEDRWAGKTRWELFSSKRMQSLTMKNCNKTFCKSIVKNFKMTFWCSG